jgi:hypothetical protein
MMVLAGLGGDEGLQGGKTFLPCFLPNHNFFSG